MKVLFDTSVLTAAVVEAHPRHDAALPWLQKAHRGTVEAIVSAHSLAELYAVLSSLPVKPRIGPALAGRLVRENVEAVARIVALTAAEYSALLSDLAERGIAGGAVYDALIARVAEKAHADLLLTLNQRDFERVGVSEVVRIRTP